MTTSTESRSRAGESGAPETLRDFYDRDRDALDSDPLLPRRHEELLRLLEAGTLRAALRDSEGVWTAEPWIKQGILAGFRNSTTAEQANGVGTAFDRSAFPVRRLTAADDVRLVPGGSAIRRGACVGQGTVMMPPSYVNVGAYVGAGTMIDSHVLVGSCAQVGERVHLSTGVQLGGVLEPASALPVVIENDCFLGAQSGVFEGVVVGSRAVLAPGVQLTASTTLYDLVREQAYRGSVPAGAVVVPGSRAVAGAYGRAEGLSTYVPIVVKYRDESTDAAVALEAALRTGTGSGLIPGGGRMVQ